MAANSPESPVPMITVSKCRGCIGFPAYADTSLDAIKAPVNMAGNASHRELAEH
jgi:hypothetical protein